MTSPPLWRRGAMYTENISRNGLLIAWRGEGAPLAPPVLGQILSIEIELPANHGFGQKCIHCEGTVVRVAAPETECPRVALDVSYMDFRSFQDRVRCFEAMNPVTTTWMA